MAKGVNPLDFFAGEQAVLPTGGTGGGGNRGFVSLWESATLYTFMTQQGPDALSVKPLFDGIRGQSDWHKYFFRTYEDGNKAAKGVGAGNVGQALVFITEIKNVLNNKDLVKLAESFKGPRITWDVNVLSLVSKLHRHPYHMISLPAIVAAAADLFEYDNPGFDLSELSGRADEFVTTDELQAKLVGSPDAGPDAPSYYKNSEYWKRREALWAALGEPNAEAYQLKGTVNTDKKGVTKPAPYCTTSDRLNMCLRAATVNWATPKWCQVATVNNPAVGAKDKFIPVVLRFFVDKADAQAYAKSIMGDEEGADANGNGSATGGKPAYPAGWAEMPEEWESNLATALSEGKSNADIVKELGDCSVKDVANWRKFLAVA